MHRLFYGWAGNQVDAEDLTTETFLRIARQLDEPRPAEGIDGWILMTSRGVLADHCQRYYHGSALLALDQGQWRDTSGQGEPLLLCAEAARLVKCILERLPDHHRRILELRFLHGSSVADTAQELGITPECALVLPRRALAEALRGTQVSLCSRGKGLEPRTI